MKQIQEDLTVKKSSRYSIGLLLLLLVGSFFVILPRLLPMNGPVYVLSPYIYLFCYLFYLTRITEKKSLVWFSLVFLAANEIRYFRLLGDEYTWQSFLIMIPIVLIFLISFVAYWAFHLRTTGFWLSLSFPLYRVGTELLSNVTRLGGHFNLSLTQFDDKYLLQMVSVTGEYALSFLVAWVAALLVWLANILIAWRLRPQGPGTAKRRERKRKLTICICLLAVFGLIHIPGGFRYENAAKERKTVVMRTSTGNNKAELAEGESDPSYDEVLDSLQSNVAAAVQDGAEMLAFAEEAYYVADTELDGLLQRTCQLARENSLYILLTAEVYDTDGDDDYLERNIAVLIDKYGEVQEYYLKNTLVPLVETGYTVEGTSGIPTVTCEFNEATCDISFSICYDGDFGEYVRNMKESSEMYIDPTWDWGAIDDMHFRTIGLRAVENGISTFKPARNGWTTVTSAVGNLTFAGEAEEWETDKGFTVEVPIQHIFTIYRWTGDIFAWIAGLGAIAMCTVQIVRLILRLKHKKEVKNT